MLEELIFMVKPHEKHEDLSEDEVILYPGTLQNAIEGAVVFPDYIYFYWTVEIPDILLNTSQWCQKLGAVIINPQGWLEMPGGPVSRSLWFEKITREEFDARLRISIYDDNCYDPEVAQDPEPSEEDVRMAMVILEDQEPLKESYLRSSFHSFYTHDDGRLCGWHPILGIWITGLDNHGRQSRCLRTDHNHPRTP